MTLNRTNNYVIVKRVLEESLNVSNPNRIESAYRPLVLNTDYDDSFKSILEISKREEEERRNRAEQEDEELRKIIELSLTEK